MTDTPIIRFATKSDLNDLIEFCALHAVFEKCEYDASGKKEKLEQHLFSASPSLFCLVAEHAGNVVGYTTYMKQFSTWDAASYLYMDCLFLKENARNHGIGELLINRIKEEAKSHHCSLIQWQTPDFNVRAMKFYDRIGAKSKSKERYFLNV